MKFWHYWTMGWHMLLTSITNAWNNAPYCSGPCEGGRAPCKCETGRRREDTSPRKEQP